MNADSKKMAMALGLGFELVVLCAIGAYAGRHADHAYGWPGYGMTAGGMAGLTLWVIHVLVASRDLSSDTDESGTKK